MPVDTKHPDLTADVEATWAMCRDAYAGAGTVKAKRETYLPMPSAYKAAQEVTQGRAAYDAYLKRAVFPEIFASAVTALSGVIHAKEFAIQMPTALEAIWESATVDDDPLESLSRRITEELLTVGRFVLVVDIGADGFPYIAPYEAEALINWDASQEFFVLDECGKTRKGFNWVDAYTWRVIEKIDGKVFATEWTKADKNAKPIAGEAVQMIARGGKPIDRVPVVVIGAHDLAVKLDTPPLAGVAMHSMAWYQTYADLRNILHNATQPTLVVINAEAPSSIGPLTVMQLVNDIKDPDAKWIVPDSAASEAHEKRLDAEVEGAARSGARLFSQAGSSQESGEARRLRFGAETASLVTIAQASAKGLEAALRHCATLIGADPAEVIVDAPEDFLDTTMTPADAKILLDIYTGHGMTWADYWSNLQRGGLVSQDKDAEEALSEVMTEVDPMEFLPSAGNPQAMPAQ